MAKGITLRNRNGTEIFFPRTKINLVFDSDGASLDNYLQSLEESLTYFLGEYTSYENLKNAHPSSEGGKFAYVNPLGEDAVKYIWDANDNKWVYSGKLIGVQEVNGKTTSVITLGGQDIEASVTIDGVTTIQNISGFLQNLYDDISNIRNEIDISIDEHNTDETAHNDIRELIENNVPILEKEIGEITLEDKNKIIKTNDDKYYFVKDTQSNVLLSGLTPNTQIDLLEDIYNKFKNEDIFKEDPETTVTFFEINTYNQEDAITKTLELEVVLTTNSSIQDGTGDRIDSLSCGIAELINDYGIYKRSNVVYRNGNLLHTYNNGWGNPSFTNERLDLEIPEGGYAIITEKDSTSYPRISGEFLNYFYDVFFNSHLSAGVYNISLKDDLSNHNTDETAHNDIREQIDSSVLSGTLNYLQEGTDILDLVLDSNNIGKTFYLDPNIVYPNEPFNGSWLNYYNLKMARKITVSTMGVFNKTFLNYQTELSIQSTIPLFEHSILLSNLHAIYNLSTNQFDIQSGSDYFVDLSTEGNPDIWKLGNVPTTQINTNKSLISGSSHLSINEDWLNEQLNEQLKIEEKYPEDVTLSDYNKLVKRGNDLIFTNAVLAFVNEVPLEEGYIFQRYNNETITINQDKDLEYLSDEFIWMGDIQYYVDDNGGTISINMQNLLFEVKDEFGQDVFDSQAYLITEISATDNGDGTISQTTTFNLKASIDLYNIAVFERTFERDSFNVSSQNSFFNYNTLPIFTDYPELFEFKVSSIFKDSARDFFLYSGEGMRLEERQIAYRSDIRTPLKPILQINSLAGVSDSYFLDRFVSIDNKLYQVKTVTEQKENEPLLIYGTTLTSNPKVNTDLTLEETFDAIAYNIEELVDTVEVEGLPTLGTSYDYLYHMYNGPQGLEFSLEMYVQLTDDTDGALIEATFKIVDGGHNTLYTIGTHNRKIEYGSHAISNKSDNLLLSEIPIFTDYTNIDDVEVVEIHPVFNEVLGKAFFLYDGLYQGPAPVEIFYANDFVLNEIDLTLTQLDWSTGELVFNTLGTDLEGLDLTNYVLDIQRSLVSKDIYIKTKTADTITFETDNEPVADIVIKLKYQRKNI